MPYSSKRTDLSYTKDNLTTLVRVAPGDKPFKLFTMNITIQRTTPERLEITPPVFYKDIVGTTTTLVGLLDDKTYIRVFQSTGLTCITNSVPEERTLAREVLYTPITESEFMAGWEKAYRGMSLEPVIIEGKEAEPWHKKHGR